MVEKYAALKMNDLLKLRSRHTEKETSNGNKLVKSIKQKNSILFYFIINLEKLLF